MREHFLYDQLSLKEIFSKLAESPCGNLYDFFFNKYYPKLIWAALIFVKQQSRAEEVVSDVMLNIFMKREKLAKTDNIEGYIFISVKNQSLKYLRKNKPLLYFDNFERDAGVHLITAVSPEYEYMENEFRQAIISTVQSLPPKRKLVFKLIKEDGLKYNDVAKLLNLSVKTVETHMGLALKTLHECIRNYNDENQTEKLNYSIAN